MISRASGRMTPLGIRINGAATIDSRNVGSRGDVAQPLLRLVQCLIDRDDPRATVHAKA